MQYAVLDENNVVAKILTDDEAFSSFLPKTAVIIDNIWPKPQPGWKLVKGELVPGTYIPTIKPKLYLSADKPAVMADGADVVKITAELKDNDGNLLDINTTDYAVIKNYGAIEVTFVNGVANVDLIVPPEKSGKLTFTCQDSTKYEVVETLTIFAILK